MSLDCFLKSGNFEDFLICRPFENFLKSGDLKDFLHIGVKRDTKLVYFEEGDDDVILLPSPSAKNELLYFEKQEKGFCLVHAFNNIVQNKKRGLPLLNAADLFKTNVFINDTSKTEIDLKDGNFFIASLAEIIKNKPNWKIKLSNEELVHGFQSQDDLDEQRTFLANSLKDNKVLGLIIGDGGHWVAAFKWYSEFLFVDSNNTTDISKFGEGPVIKIPNKNHPSFENAESLIDYCYQYIYKPSIVSGSISILCNDA